MKLLFFITAIAIAWALSGCATAFERNVSEVRRACKGNVSEYDDGTINFKCSTNGVSK